MWNVLIKTPRVNQNYTIPTTTINAPCEIRLSSPKSPQQRVSFAGSWQQQEQPARLPVMSEQQSIQACQKHTQPWQGGFKASRDRRDGKKEKGKGGGRRRNAEGERERETLLTLQAVHGKALKLHQGDALHRGLQVKLQAVRVLLPPVSS